MDTLDVQPRRITAFAWFLRIYGVLTLLIFVPLFLGFLVRTPLLAEQGGPLTCVRRNSGHLETVMG
ncbi:hypothetical protein ITP53_08025 [Nonomuraea sp. K274]|uniref:Uncharacterized protein n=1 Tax=Nonomuraea cypriaca TaxID=1187855 RepID=A0A931A3T5_9ACTN|nr:hypothetical protein [Nonomuraea cypriaca]MBF8185686.1 hypothetical protein [Nonomuraea cypriaca]